MRNFFCVVLVVLFGCQQKINSPTEFFEWLNNPKNGLIQSKKVDGMEITVKYLPPEYLSMKELKGKYEADKASKLKAQYEKSLAFLITFKPIDKQDGDIMFRNIRDKQDYDQRLMSLSFGMEKYISIKIKGTNYPPILSTLEQTYSTTKHRSVYLVFGGENLGNIKKEKEWDIVFEDTIFETGIHHFEFNRDNLLNLPKLNFWLK